MDANLTKVLFAAETSFGVVPSPAATLQEVRFTGSSLIHDKLTAMSEAVRADRARDSLIEVGKNASGSLEAELTIGPWNTWILNALKAASWTTGTESVTATAVASTGTITASVGTFSDDLQGARYVDIQGFANAENNGIKRVVSCTETVLTVSGLSVNEAADITVQFRYARNGSTRNTMLIEQQYLDATPNQFIAFLGMAVNEWTLTMEAQSKINQTFALMGTESELASATVGDGSPTAASTRRVCNTTTNIGTLYWDGDAISANVMSFDLTLGNNLRNRPAIGRATTLSHGIGRSVPDGTISTYFETPALYESFLSHTAAALELPITDPDGNLLSLYMPHVEFPSGFPSIEGVDTDVMLELEFNATAHPTESYIIQIDQLDYTEQSSS